MSKKQAVLNKLAEALTIALDEPVTIAINEKETWVKVTFAEGGFSQGINVTMDSPVGMMYDILDKMC